MGRLVQRCASSSNPVSHPLPQHRQRHRGLAEQRAAAARIAQQRDGSFGIHEPRRAAEDRTEPFGRLADGDAFRPRHVEDGGRRGAQLEASQRVTVRVPLPDRIEEPHRQIDGLAGEHLARDVHERAVAQIDGVVEPEDERAQVPLARHELDDALASEARLRVLARRAPADRLRWIRDRRPAPADKRCRSRTRPSATARSARPRARERCVFVAHVTSVRSSVPNFRPARNSTFSARGSAAIWSGSSRSHATRLDAVRLEPLAHRGRRESRHRQHPAPGCRPGRWPGGRAARATAPSCPRAPMIRTSPFRRLTQSRSRRGRLGEEILERVSSRTSALHQKRTPDSQPHDPPHREPFGAAHGVGVEHGGRAVRRPRR